MTDDRHETPFASSPCMMAEFAEGDVVRLFYLHIEERGGGFIWQVRRHDLETPIETGKNTCRSEADARAAGQHALDRACEHFHRFGFPS